MPDGPESSYISSQEKPATPATDSDYSYTKEQHIPDVSVMSVPRWLLLVLVLGGLTAFGPLSIDMYLPALPRIGEELGGSASYVQLTLTACVAGLAVGQLLAGPLSDQFGRRMPLLVGTLGFAVASIACAFAPSVPTLVVLRFVQGLAGAAGIVITGAVVRDLYEGVAAARFFSRVMLVIGLAPIFAPVIGAQVSALVGWRGVFWVLAALGTILLVGVASSAPTPGPRAGALPQGWAQCFARWRP